MTDQMTPPADRYRPTIASVREHYGEMTESLAGPDIVPGNLHLFDQALAAHDVDVATAAVAAKGVPVAQLADVIEAAVAEWAALGPGAVPAADSLARSRDLHVAESVLTALGLPATAVPARARDEQHPRKADGTWMAHCNVCGTYVDDWTTEPPVDFLCDECQEAGEDEESTA